MQKVYHEAHCRFEIDDIVTLTGLENERFKIEEIVLVQFVKANRMEFHFMLRNAINGEMCDGWVPFHMMGEIVQFANGEKPKQE